MEGGREEGTARKRKRDDYPRCCAHNANLHPCDLSCEFEATKRAVWCRMVEESYEEATDRDIYSIRKLEGRSFLSTFLKRSRKRERERTGYTFDVETVFKDGILRDE